MGKQFNIRDMPERSQEQLTQLVEWTGYTKVYIMLQGLEKFWQEIKKERENKMQATAQMTWNNDTQRYYYTYDDGRVLWVDGDVLEAVHDAIKAEHGDINPDDERYDQIYDAAKEELLDPNMWENNALEVTPGKRLEDMDNFYQYDAWIATEVGLVK